MEFIFIYLPMEFARIPGSITLQLAKAIMAAARKVKMMAIFIFTQKREN